MAAALVIASSWEAIQGGQPVLARLDCFAFGSQ
jgi:hypothetical protein